MALRGLSDLSHRVVWYDSQVSGTSSAQGPGARVIYIYIYRMVRGHDCLYSIYSIQYVSNEMAEGDRSRNMFLICFVPRKSLNILGSV